MLDDLWREAVALKRYRSHRMMLIGDEPQSYPSYRGIAAGRLYPAMVSLVRAQIANITLNGAMILACNSNPG